MFVEKLLSEPSWRHICFMSGEGEGADAGGGGGEPSETEALEAALVADNEPPVEGDEDDLPELEIGPDKIKVDKRVKEAWDGFQKSAQVKAEEYKTEKASIAEQRKQVEEFGRTLTTVVEEIGELKAIDKDLAPYLKLTPQDWMNWAQQDPDKAQQAQIGINALNARRAQLAGSIQQKVTDAGTAQTKAQQETRSKAEAEVAKNIKDWSPTKRQELVKHGIERGYSAEEIEPFLYDHRSVSILEDAAAMRALRAKVAAKNTAPKQVETEPQPRVRANTGSQANDLSDRVPIEQWAKNFSKLRQRGA